MLLAAIYRRFWSSIPPVMKIRDCDFPQFRFSSCTVPIPRPTSLPSPLKMPWISSSAIYAVVDLLRWRSWGWGRSDVWMAFRSKYFSLRLPCTWRCCFLMYSSWKFMWAWLRRRGGRALPRSSFSAFKNRIENYQITPSDYHISLTSIAWSPRLSRSTTLADE